VRKVIVQGDSVGRGYGRLSGRVQELDLRKCGLLRGNVGVAVVASER